MRPAFDALLDIDAAMADVVIKATEPTLAAIKLAWWRERLVELDQGKVPAEPRLQAAASELPARGISGLELSQLEEGWAALLQPAPDSDRLLARGAALFSLAGRLIQDEPAPLLEPAGRLFAAGQLKRTGRSVGGAPSAADIPRVAPPLRPLTGLAALAARDLQRVEPEATPARALALLRHRLTGRVG